MLILRHFHGILVGKDKDNLRFPIFDEQNVSSIMGQVGWLPRVFSRRIVPFVFTNV
jgi:hypothetical protein